MLPRYLKNNLFQKNFIHNAVGLGSTAPVAAPAEKLFHSHFDGTDGSTSFIDIMGNTLTAVGGAALSTNFVVDGTASLSCVSSSIVKGIYCSNSNFFVGLDDEWMLEGWFRRQGAATQDLIGLGILAGTGLRFVWNTSASRPDFQGSPWHSGGGVYMSNVAGWVSVPDINGFKHFFIGCKNRKAYLGFGGLTSVKAFVNTDALMYSNYLEIGAPGAGSGGSSGITHAYFDEIRFLKGSGALLYTGNHGDSYTIPSGAFPD